MAGFQPSKLEQLVRAIEELPDEQVRLTVSEIMMRYLSWTAPSGEPMIFNGASVGVNHRLRAIQLADILTTLERNGFLVINMQELSEDFQERMRRLHSAHYAQLPTATQD